MLLMLKGICGDDFVVVSGASEVKRGEVVGRLHIPSLEKEGVERVLWAAFVKSKGKAIDEVNRLNPYTTANIHHLMQFGEVWAYGKKVKISDYLLIANENPMDATSFIHPQPFYDRFDICLFLRSLTLSEKFQLQDLLEKYDGNLIDSMPQVLSFEELEEARRQVSEMEMDPAQIGFINQIVRDFQACIRDKENSEIKPPTLCEGCHFVRDLCSRIKEPLSERATVALVHLAKAAKWLDVKCELEDILRMAFWILPHRLSLVRTRNVPADIKDLLGAERIKMADRDARRQWTILNELLKGFDRSVYRLAREAAIEDVVFAEELMKIEKMWVRKGLIKPEETLFSQMDWKSSSYEE
jgi:MoxR-like ATPase